jgi:hypothetical protein
LRLDHLGIMSSSITFVWNHQNKAYTPNDVNFHERNRTKLFMLSEDFDYFFHISLIVSYDKVTFATRVTEFLNKFRRVEMNSISRIVSLLSAFHLC